MCVPQSLDKARKSFALVQMRAVGIALLVGIGVMTPVVRNPGDHGSLDSHRSGDTEENLYRLGCLERAVCEIAMQTGLHT